MMGTHGADCRPPLSFDALEGALKPMNTADDLDACGIPKGTLAYWRRTGAGPAYVRKGRRVLYPREAVLAWLRGGTHDGTGD